MNPVKTRVISAVAMALIATIGLVPFPLLRSYFIIAILGIGAFEYFKVWNQLELQPLAKRVPLAFTGWVMLLLLLKVNLTWLFPNAMVWVLCIGVIAWVWHAFYHLPIQSIFPWLQFHFFGLGLFGFWASSVLDLVNWEPGFKGLYPLIATVFCMTFADSGAFFVGRKWGKHKLAPTLSPKKTKEGFVGGLLCAVFVAILLFPLLPQFGILQRAGFGILMAITATLGDLFFSCIKRWSGIKDFGSLIPGHGGILDRFDSLFFSAPFALYYISLS